MAKIPTQKEEKQATAKIPTHKYNKVSPIGKNQIEYKRSLESNTLTIVRGPAGTGKCVEYNTLIPTEKGLEYIGELMSSTLEDGYYDLEKSVFGHDGIEKTSKFYKESNAKTLRLKTYQNYEICGTHEHPILTFNGAKFEFKELDKIEKGDVVCIDRSFKDFDIQNPKIDFEYVKTIHATNLKDIILPETMTPDIAKVFGYLIANGSCTSSSAIFSSNNFNLQDDYYESVETAFGLSSKRLKGDDDIITHSAKLVKFIEYFCNEFKTARFKQVPKLVLQSNLETKRNFIRTLFDCDGSLYNNTFEYSTASEILSKEVQILLLDFGIISRRKTRYNKKYDHTYFSIYITSNDLNLLFDRIMFDTLKYDFTFIDNTNTNIDKIYGLNEFILKEVNTCKVTLNSQKNGMYLFNAVRKRFNFTFDSWDLKSKEVTYKKLDNIINAYESSHPEIQSELEPLYELLCTLSERNYFYDLVTSVEDDGIKTVYDFTVPKTHSFVSNGFISHNTFLASVEAAEQLRDRVINKIVLVRPYVDLNNRGIGYLKGTEHEKLEPYVRPMLDAIKYVVGPLQLQKYLEEGAIEVKALASIRGMSYKETFLICDEMQGTVPNEIQALTTRIGKDSKMVIVGDTRQTDVRQGKENGLDYLIRIVDTYPIRDTGVIEMDINDIQRSGITKDFVLAYEKEGWQ